MEDITGGNNIHYYNVDKFLYNTKLTIHEVRLFNRITTNKNNCNNCNGKLLKKDKELVIKEEYVIDFIFIFKEYCTCCGAHFFKKQGKLLFVIDEKSINKRKAKINRLEKLTK